MLVRGLRSPCKRKKRRKRRRANASKAEGKHPGPVCASREETGCEGTPPGPPRGPGAAVGTGAAGGAAGGAPRGAARGHRRAGAGRRSGGCAACSQSHEPPGSRAAPALLPPHPFGREWHGPDALVRKEGAGEPLSGGGGTRQPPAGNTLSPGRCGGGSGRDRLSAGCRSRRAMVVPRGQEYQAPQEVP